MIIFTVYRKRAKEVLLALREWNNKRPLGPVAFHTQGSIDAARDPEIMRLCGEAGLVRVFIGIETPNEDSLKEIIEAAKCRHRFDPGNAGLPRSWYCRDSWNDCWL